MKKLIPALVLLLVSAIVLSTSSYAWFSMNRTVQATGISLTAAAPTNLVISADNVTYNATAALTNPAGDSRLYPASSHDGATFHAIADGNVLGGGAGGKAEAGTTRFLPDAQVVEMGAADGWFVEYTLYFKATASTDAALNIGVKSITATVADSDIQEAVRVAIDDGVNAPKIYAVDETEEVLPVTEVTQKGEDPDIYYVAEADDFAAADPKVKVGDGEGGNVVAFTVTPAVNALGSETEITVRVWIEGEHSACINANALKDLGLTLEFYVIGD